MWKCVCDICGKEMIPLDAKECTFRIQDTRKRIIHVLKIFIDTHQWVEELTPIFDGQLCIDCKCKLIERLTESTRDIITKMKAEKHEN